MADKPLEVHPCPFCGGTDLGIGRGTEDSEGYPTYVYCADCGARGPYIYTRSKGLWTCTPLACEETGWNDQKRIAELEAKLQDSEECRRNYRENTADEMQDLSIANERIAGLEAAWLKVCHEGCLPQYEAATSVFPNGILHGVRQLSALFKNEALLHERAKAKIAELEAEVAEMKARLSSIPRGHAGKSEDDIIVGSCLRRGCPQARNEGQE